MPEKTNPIKSCQQKTNRGTNGRPASTYIDQLCRETSWRSSNPDARARLAWKTKLPSL